MVPSGIHTFIYIENKKTTYMENSNCYCIILAGGIGTRFWPISKTAMPKQFLDVADTGQSFLRQTYDRFLNIIPKDNILVITAARYRETVMEQLPELEEGNLLLEPYGRNTAPCIAYATYALLKRNPDAKVVVSPSDHIIDNDEVFAKTLHDAFRYIDEKDVLMTLGVVPTRPDTNYGYVQACGGREAYKNNEPLPIKTFTEKPDKDLASIFISTGEFLWNAGIFLWKARTIKEEMERYLPEVTKQFAGWESAIGTRIEKEFIDRAYTGCPNISIGYGVMEKTDRAWIFPAHFGWQDIGTWESLYNYIPKDEDDNAINVEKTLIENTSGSLIVSLDKKKLIAVKGLEDYMIIDTPDALVICPKDDKKYKDFISGIAMPEYEKYR